MIKDEKADREERVRRTDIPSMQSSQKRVDSVLVPTWEVNERTLDWVLLPPVSQNVAEKKRGEAVASAHPKLSAAELTHERHVGPGLVGSGTLKQKLG